MMRYISGGTMPAYAETYVVREADTLLRDALREGVYCYVLTPRQMGKSSLMIHTADALSKEGVRCAAIDLSAQGANVEAAQWYRGLIETLGDRLELEDEIEAFLDQSAHLSPLQRWQTALREVILAHIDGPVVIFLDEIDITRTFSRFSSDELFVAIRSCYNARTVDAAWNRLTFCLLGAAAPTDLIRDQRITPFNIGRRIDLHDFTPKEASLLRMGLGLDDETNRRLMARITHWTRGHPYLTQRLCKEVAEAVARGQWQPDTLANVDDICRRLFLTPEQGRSEPNLVFVRQRLAVEKEEERAALLTLYREILRGRRIADNETDERVGPLKISGVVRAENGRLVVRNRIYQTVFDARWVRNQMPGQEKRRQRAAFRRGVARAALIWVPTLCCTLFAVLLWRRAEDSQMQRQMVQERADRDQYVYDLYKAQRQWEDGDTAGTVRLLEAHIPHTGEKDRRGFEWRYLWRQAHLETKLLAGHKQGVYSLACSLDGRILASGGFDHTVILWDSATGREIRRIVGLLGWVCDLAFSRDGRLLAIATGGSRKAEVGLYETKCLGQAEPRWRYPATADAIDGLVFSADGRSLFARFEGVGADNLVTLNAATGSRQHSVAFSATSEGSKIALSPDGGMLAVIDGSRQQPANWIKLYSADLKPSTTLRQNLVPNAVLDSLACSPDGHTLAATSATGHLFLWDLRHPARAPRRLASGDSQCLQLAFSPDGSVLVVPSWDGVVRLFSLPSAKALPSVRGHTNLVNAAVFVDHGRTLATAGNDTTIRLWDMNEVQRDPANPRHVRRRSLTCWSPPGSVLASWSRTTRSQGRLRLVDAKTLQTVRQIPTSSDILEISVPECGYPVFGWTQHRIVTWGPVSNEEHLFANGDFDHPVSSPDGRRLAALEGDRVVVFDTTTGLPVQHISPGLGSSGIYTYAFSPNSRMLAVAWRGPVSASSTHPYHVLVWDLVTNSAVKNLDMPHDMAQSVAFSADSRWLAASDWSGPVEIWDTATYKPVAELQGHKEFAAALAFSPDGTTLATVGVRDHTVKLWNVATWQEIIRLHTPLSVENSGTSINFSPDGNMLIVTSPTDVCEWQAMPIAGIPQTR